MSKAQAKAIDLAAITYKDLINLIYRTGTMQIIQAHSVHENDEFMYEQGSLHHEPAETNRGNVTHYYAMYQTMDGSCGFAVMSREDIVPEGIPEDIVADTAKKVVTLRALRQCLKAG